MTGWNLVAASAMAERWCLGGVHPPSCNRRLARSVAVSVRAQKKGGLPTHPMGRTNGNATRGSSSS